MSNQDNEFSFIFFGRLGLFAGALTSLSACGGTDCGASRDCFVPEHTHSAGGQGGAGQREQSEQSDGSEVFMDMGGSDGGSAKAPEVEPVCSPDMVDEPDDDFFDQNCDGIDGDIHAAIFVSPRGGDDALGQIDDPVASVARAMELARLQKKDIYVCSHDYDESLEIGEDGLRIYGGFDCGNDWSRTDSHASFTASSGAALQVAGVEGLILDHLEFRGADASGSLDSSFGATVVDSTAVEFREVVVVGGRGLAGTDGEAGAVYTTAPSARPAGKVCPSCALGAPASYVFGYNYCLDDSKTTTGGRGGKGQGFGSRVVDAPENGSTPTGGGEGGRVSATASIRNGKPGPTGAPGAKGKVSSDLVGSFAGLSYAGTNAGGSGSPGSHGGSGGGGAGGLRGYPDDVVVVAGAGGAQGGTGGCRGMPGTGGQGGGASFALVVSDSELTLSGGELVSGSAGAGGMGAPGAAGQVGGKGGEVDSYFAAGAGGDGGKGGSGGDGAPGGGGPSIPLALISGEAPQVVGVKFSPGSGGAGGAGVGGVMGLTGLSVPAYDFGERAELNLE